MSKFKRSILYASLMTATCVVAACSSVPAQIQAAATRPNTTPQTALPVAARASGSAETAIPTQETALAPDVNTVGDIPDSQVFVNYASPDGTYSLDVPEGWARTTNGTDVRFVDKFNGLSVSLKPAASAPTAASAAKNEVAQLIQAGHAFQAGPVTEMDLPSGHVVKVSATLNSDPDPVTGKQVRLEEDVYFFFHNAMEATLQLWSPQGSDNVDPWKRISESFRWH